MLIGGIAVGCKVWNKSVNIRDSSLTSSSHEFSVTNSWIRVYYANCRNNKLRACTYINISTRVIYTYIYVKQS